jgi:hypothetical protein
VIDRLTLCQPAAVSPGCGQAAVAMEVWEPPGSLGPRLQGDSPEGRRHFPAGARLRRPPHGGGGGKAEGPPWL